MLRLVARHADVWNCPVYGIDAVRDPAAAERFHAALDRLHELCAEIGRDPAEIRPLLQIRWDGRDPQYLLEHCAIWLEAGFTEQVVYLEPLEIHPHDVAGVAEAAALLLPQLRSLATH